MKEGGGGEEHTKKRKNTSVVEYEPKVVIERDLVACLFVIFIAKKHK